MNAQVNLAGNPEDLPSNPEEIAALLNPDATGKQTTTEKPAGDAGKEGAATVGAKGDLREDEIAGVLLKDGKHVLPYEEHVRVRREAAEARQRADQERAAREQAESERKALEERVKELETKATEVAAGKSTQTDEQWNEMMAELEKEVPAIASVLRAQREQDVSRLEQLNTTIADLRAQLDTVSSAVRATETVTQQTLDEMAVQALDETPKLRYLRDQMPELFTEAVEADKAIRDLPTWAKMEASVPNFKKRYAAVIAQIEAAHGAIELPPEYLPVEQVREDAKKKAEAAGDFRPATLSDLPGGATPSGGRPVASSMDAATLAANMMQMSEEQMADILARVG